MINKLGLAGVALASVVFGLLLYQIYNSIYESGFGDGIAFKQVEIDRMQAANQKAMTDAVKVQDALREQIKEQFILSQTMLENLRNEADNDPAAHTGGLSSSSVRRLNSIR